MDILNVMWSGGAAFVSVHKVHRDILRLLEPGASIESLLLQAGEAEPLLSVGQVSSLGRSSEQIKGRGFSALTRLWDRRRLAGWLVLQRPRVVLLDGVGVAAYVLPLLLRLPATRVVVLFHGVKRLKAEHVALLKGYPPERLSLVAVSATLAADLEGQLGCKVLGGRVAIDPAAFRAVLVEREVAQRALGLSVQQGLVIGAVGRLVPEKGFSLLIRSIADWLVSNPHDRLVIVGEGPEREKLADLAQELKVSRQVHLVGHYDQAPHLYSAFDLVCIPSEQEGLGLVLSEAIIAGVPVLASDLPVFREQLGADVKLLPPVMEAWRDALSGALANDLRPLAEAQRVGMGAETAWVRFQEFYRQLFAI